MGKDPEFTAPAISHLKQKIEQLVMQLSEELPLANDSVSVIGKKKGFGAGSTFGEWFRTFCSNFYLEHEQNWNALAQLFKSPIQVPTPRNMPKEYRFRYRAFRDGAETRLWKDLSFSAPLKDILNGKIRDRNYLCKGLNSADRGLIMKAEDLFVQIPAEKNNGITRNKLLERIIIAALEKHGKMDIRALAKITGLLIISKSKYEGEFENSDEDRPRRLLTRKLESLVGSGVVLETAHREYELTHTTP